MAYSIKIWDLTQLFPGFDSPELQAAFDNVEEQVASFEGVRGKLDPNMDVETFLEVVRVSEATSRLVNRIYAFAGLAFAEDTQNQHAQTMIARVQQFAAEMQNRTMFFSLWWKDLDEKNAERLMSTSGGLRRVLFDRPVLKLFLVLLFIVVGSTLAQTMSIKVFTLLVAAVTVIAVAYAVVLIGHIVSIYLIRRPIGRLLSAKDIASLLFSYVMMIVGILLVMTVLFIVVEELHLGYLTHGPTSDAFNKDVIYSGDPNLSQDYLYFSAVTFFTVGYGDITPLSLWRRRWPGWKRSLDRCTSQS